MNPEFRNLRAKQLERALQPFIAAKGTLRPPKGWIRAIREVAGISVRGLAKQLSKSPSSGLVPHLEKSEAEYRITLGRLRDAAEALGCQLVYALVPKTGRVQDLLEQRARTKADENVRAVEHSMALENQAVGGVEEKIAEQTKKNLKGS
jgi:predicted DNA-binding mobile mystery protein A